MELSKQVDKKIRLIARSEENLIEGIQAIEEDLYQRLLRILKQLDTDGGKFLSTARNKSIIARFSADVEKTLATGAFHDEASKWISIFDDIDELNGAIFNTLTGQITIETIKSLVGPYREAVVDSIVSALTDYPSLSYGIAAPLKRSIMRNIVLGSTYEEVEMSVLGFVKGQKGAGGMINKWVTQLSRDALNQYDGASQKKIADELGMDAFMFVGPLMTTSRPTCIHMINAPDAVTIEKKVKGGKTRMVKQSNIFADIVQPDGGYLMKDIPTIISRGQGTPGWNPNTTEETYLAIRNGYNCNHNAIPYLSDSEDQSKQLSLTQKELS